jgi:hypothetical protein
MIANTSTIGLSWMTGNYGLQFLREVEIVAKIFFYFHQNDLLHFPFICILIFFCPLEISLMLHCPKLSLNLDAISPN